MPALTVDVDIAADREHVFAALLDSATYQDWLALHAAWPDGPPQITAGGEFAQDVNLIGRAAQIRWAVAEFEVPSALALNGRGPMGFAIRARYGLTEENGGTILRYEGEFDGGPLPLNGRLGKIVTQKVNASVEESLAALKVMIEEQSAGRPHAPRGPLARRRPLRRTVSNADLLAAIEANARALAVLTEEIGRVNEQVSRVSWLSGPLDLLRRGAGQKDSDEGGSDPPA